MSARHVDSCGMILKLKSMIKWHFAGTESEHKKQDSNSSPYMTY